MVQQKDIKSETSIILTGPTATGKSSLAIELAAQLNLEIINADSVCFYQEFNIGSAKPTPTELAKVPHHLIDIAHPLDHYHAGQFLKDFEEALISIHQQGKKALIVGGSGFYLKALRLGLWQAPPTSLEFRETLKNKTNEELYLEVSRIDPIHAKKISVSDRYRLIRALEIFTLSGETPSALESKMPTEPDSRFQLWVIDRNKDELTLRMRKRAEAMVKEGLVEETQALREKYPDSKTLHAVGYQQVLDYLDGKKPEGRQIRDGVSGLIDEIELAHRQLAKQQRTWFKNLKPNESFVLDQDRSLLIEKLMKQYQ